MASHNNLCFPKIKNDFPYTPSTQDSLSHTDKQVEGSKIMCKVFLTTDPMTQRGLYDDESKFLGIFQSLRDAEQALGDLLNFCTIRFVR
ncbi:MAG: hypothetical protein C0406_10520 [Sideroxydans sp.]|nr:hypothetical protein [Sideroxydans sp.]